MRRETIRIERKHKKRVGRGNSSGKGTYSGRGMKGQKSRAGARIRPGFEGGQTTLVQRLPKKRGGMKTATEKVFPVNVAALERAFSANTQVDYRSLLDAKLVPEGVKRIKVLGDGNLTKPLTVLLPTSAAAKKKIEDAGGKLS